MPAKARMKSKRSTLKEESCDQLPGQLSPQLLRELRLKRIVPLRDQRPRPAKKSPGTNNELRELKQSFRETFGPSSETNAKDWKAKESRLVGLLRKQLHFMQRSGEIRAWSRLQSGMVRVQYPGGKAYWMHLCEDGTPDFFIVHNSGTMLWVELKSHDGKQRPGQKNFQERLGGQPGHQYLLINSTQSLDELIQKCRKADYSWHVNPNK